MVIEQNTLYPLSDMGRRVREQLLVEWRELSRVVESIVEEANHEDR